MTLDSSVLIAILFAEPGYLDLVDAVLNPSMQDQRPITVNDSWLVVAPRPWTVAPPGR